jgi:glycerol uptake facilitator-like aquaporin
MPVANPEIVDIVVTCLIEVVFTTILCIFIFWNFKPADSNGGKYRKALAIGDSDFTYGPFITGAVLALLIFLSVTIYKYTSEAGFPTSNGISAGHMFPLITVPAMFPDGLGIIKVTVAKGIFMLVAQFIAMFIAWAIVFGTDM